MQTLVDGLVNNLNKFNDVRLNCNENCLELDFKNVADKINVKTDKGSYDVDYVISSVYSKSKVSSLFFWGLFQMKKQIYGIYLDLGNMLSNEHSKLKTLLNKIDAVNMIVVNLYFDKNILPAQV